MAELLKYLRNIICVFELASTLATVAIFNFYFFMVWYMMPTSATAVHANPLSLHAPCQSKVALFELYGHMTMILFLVQR